VLKFEQPKKSSVKTTNKDFYTKFPPKGWENMCPKKLTIGLTICLFYASFKKDAGSRLAESLVFS
jgi:hypothetical protein